MVSFCGISRGAFPEDPFEDGGEIDYVSDFANDLLMGPMRS
jgi:hypothetical protein